MIAEDMKPPAWYWVLLMVVFPLSLPAVIQYFSGGVVYLPRWNPYLLTAIEMVIRHIPHVLAIILVAVMHHYGVQTGLKMPHDLLGTLWAVNVGMIWIALSSVAGNYLYDYYHMGTIATEIKSYDTTLHAIPSWIYFLMLIPVTGVIVPVAEELAFRGVIANWLGRTCGVGVGMVVSSALFGLAHPGMPKPIVMFAHGMGFAACFFATRSIWPGAVIHMFVNIVGLLKMAVVSYPT